MTSTIESAITDLEERRLAAMVAADTSALDDILADDLSYVHTSAAIDTKESLTSGLATGRLNYESITPTTDRAIRAHGDTAIVRGQAHVHVNGAHFTLEYTVVYVKPDGDWRMTSWHATRLPE